MSYVGEEFVHAHPARIGVLLLNLGTPDAPTPKALRRYLAEFLWDPRVVEVARPLWWLILHGVILRTRPKRSAHAYQQVWTDQGSPLMLISQQQAEQLQQCLRNRMNDTVVVELGMRYGNPSVASALHRLKAQGVRKLLVLPLYPQYSGATTASSLDAVMSELMTWRWVPELRTINQYHDEAGYIKALASSVREQWARTGQPDKLLFSFHGTPKRYHTNGDPYFCQCHKTARLVAEQLGIADDRWQLSFQSRFGREEWLKPYTNETLQQLAASGTRHVDVICPGFAADCLETLEEIVQENRRVFVDAGGGEYNYIGALNDRADHLAFLADLVVRHSAGWSEAEGHWTTINSKSVAEAGFVRARKMGAPA